MSNHHRFKLSHLMPNSWFYKLRDMKRPRAPSQRNGQSTRTCKKSSHYYNRNGTTTPRPLPLYPHKSYKYKSAKHMPLEKLRPSTLHLNPKASDIQFPRDHQQQQLLHRLPTSRANAIVYGSDDHEFQDLQLRPIRTRPVPNGSASCKCPSSPRLRSRRLNVAGGGRVSSSSASGRRRSSPARRSFAVVKASTDPPRDFRESMVEMIVDNDVHVAEDMQELLECYLSLNSSEYHAVIMEVFRGVCLEIADDIVEDDTL
ncbi:hypothetical protein BS78_09G096500 [Paspalum vaginatum]|nr:hypothetical protein BS78_09G096500 [Paspalum vaginatum]